jgi:RNA polymerase sigma-70 factor, ECF subfamily
MVDTVSIREEVLGGGQMEDLELIVRCKNGEKSAFEALIRMYHPLIFKYLCKISGDEMLAEDLVQETFIKMIRNIDKFDPYGKAKFSTYLVCIAKNCYIDYYRKEKNRANDVAIGTDFGMQDLCNMEELVIRKMDNIEVLEAVDQLTDHQKIAIRMKYIDNLTTKEIGELLNVEAKTIKSRIHNGMVILRKMLKGGDADERYK